MFFFGGSGGGVVSAENRGRAMWVHRRPAKSYRIHAARASPRVEQPSQELSHRSAEAQSRHQAVELRFWGSCFRNAATHGTVQTGSHKRLRSPQIQTPAAACCGRAAQGMPQPPCGAHTCCTRLPTQTNTIEMPQICSLHVGQPMIANHAPPHIPKHTIMLESSQRDGHLL